MKSDPLSTADADVNRCVNCGGWTWRTRPCVVCDMIESRWGAPVAVAAGLLFIVAAVVGATT